MRTIIACDVDDVLFEFYLALAVFHNRVYGTALCKKDFISYLVHEVWGGDMPTAIQKMWAFYRSESFRFSLPLVDGAVDGITRLSEAYDLHAVTGRPHAIAHITEAALARQFPQRFRVMHHTDAFSIGEGISRPKADVCRDVGASILIEDYLGHAIPCAEAGMRVILFDQPWNRGCDVSVYGIERVRSWSEALTLLL